VIQPMRGAAAIPRPGDGAVILIFSVLSAYSRTRASGEPKRLSYFFG
jgi:hypothetical protein